MTSVGSESLDILTLGVDASPLRIGWAIQHAGIILACDTWHVDRDDDIRSRREAWRSIRDHIRTAERHLDRDLSIIAIEDAYLGPNKKGSLNLARTIGHVEAFAYTAFPYAEQLRIPNATWRRALGLNRTGKAPSLSAARSILNDNLLTDQDTADAICIAVAAAYLHAEE
jgi:Holliday junction resolvasome RuvABC endonuclease subunit